MFFFRELYATRKVPGRLLRVIFAAFITDFGGKFLNLAFTTITTKATSLAFRIFASLATLNETRAKKVDNKLSQTFFCKRWDVIAIVVP